ncbi:BIR protein [Plasmodium berghei]|uniref:BIR protein n=1 Tax=Plasmodium berghei TaxID=5821 RepID=A0A0Y9V4K9_PLABE|nr:BIR protein [Plasmodium berghei]
MDKKVCGILLSINNSFSKNFDEKRGYQIIINKTILNNYCTSNKCDNDLEKISAGCLYLLDAFFMNSDLFKSVAKSNIDIVEYIIIWLSYMLSLKKQVGNKTNLQYFYDIYIKNHEKYTNSITGVDAYYNSYKDLIDQKKNLISMDMSIISKLYDVFIKLCMMHIEFDENGPNCNKYLENAKRFVEKYDELNKDPRITENSPYYKLLSTLSNDYDNFKKKCSDSKCFNSSSFPTIEKAPNSVESIKQFSEQPSAQGSAHSSGQISEQNGQSSELISAQASEVTSSNSSIENKLFTVLSVFGAIAFLLGISYKYSLFGFRKRAQKQYLREKIKNIKKRMNH